MLAVRQRAACAARRARLTTSTTRQAVRSYASDHHDHHHDDHHHAPQVEESLGLPFYVALGSIGLSIGIYTISRPGEDGELSATSKWLDSFRSGSLQSWEDRNTVRTNILNQAAVDRHTFGTVEKAKAFELRTPELFHSGSPRNVPAGHYVNIDHVVEHYRKEHLDEEERKFKKLSEANKE